MKKNKKIFLIFGILTIFIAMSFEKDFMKTNAVDTADSNQGVYYRNQVFESGGGVNYRIPSLITTNSGEIWAFCNDRHGDIRDYSDFHWICVSHSTDGINFSKPQYLLRKDGWKYAMGAAVYDAVDNNIILTYSASIRTAEAQAAYDALPASEKEPLGWCIIESKDGGKTWTQRPLVFNSTWKFGYGFLHGSSAGIQLKNGPHKGRLVFAVHTATFDTSDMTLMPQSTWACFFYSDDHGQTWQVSNLTQIPGYGESSMCELPDGTLYLNSRALYGDHTRAIAYSYDGGTTLTDCAKETGLYQTAETGVKGSVICFENPKSPGQYLTLYSCLNSNTYRKNLCIWISYDNGKTWPDIVSIYPGKSAYSEMTFNQATGLVSIMYENGTSGTYNKGIAIDTFDIDWLMVNKQKYIPDRVTNVSKTVKPVLVEDGIVVHLSADALAVYEDGATLDVWQDATQKGNDAVRYLNNPLPVIKKGVVNGYSAV